MLPDKILRLCYDDRVVEPGFLLHALRLPAVRDYYRVEATGTSDSMRNLSQPKLAATPVALAPLNEQRRIVEKIEALTARSRRAKEALDAVPALLDKLRQSILASAFRGDLTADWRAAHPNVEPAPALLERIRNARRRAWEEATLAKLKTKGTPPKDDTWKSKYVEPEPVDTEGLPELPEGWAWARWCEIGQCQNGRAFPSEDYAESGAKLLRPGNLNVSGWVEWSDKNTRYLPEKWGAEFPDYLVGPGELVMNLTAQSLKDAFLGRVCLTVEGERCLLNQRLARITPVHISAEWCFFWMKSPQFRSFVESLNTGSLIQHMFTSQVDEHVLPIPPEEEQIAMVAAIRSLLVRSEAAASVLVNHGATLQALDSAVLAKAFRGELVPQDPKDEPASVLLERIRAERATGHPVKATQAKSTSKKPQKKRN